MKIRDKISKEIGKQGCYLAGFGTCSDIVALHALKEVLESGKVKMTPCLKNILK